MGSRENLNMLLEEHKITEEVYKCILDLMDKYKLRISSGEKVHNYEFEDELTSITDIKNYHFSELLTKYFKEAECYDEVFDTLYADMLKYS